MPLVFFARRLANGVLECRPCRYRAATAHLISSPNIGLFDRIANPPGPDHERRYNGDFRQKDLRFERFTGFKAFRAAQGSATQSKSPRSGPCPIGLCRKDRPLKPPSRTTARTSIRMVPRNIGMSPIGSVAALAGLVPRAPRGRRAVSASAV